MPPAAVRILHLTPADGAGELTRLLARAREAAAEDLRRRFAGMAAARPEGDVDVAIVEGPPDGRTFGARLRDLVAEVGSGGLVVLGSGSIPLATDDDLARLLAAAAGDGPPALTNNRHSADVVAVGDVANLASVPGLASDNALPRWLEAQGIHVEELPDRWRLALDLDSPLDLELLRRHPACPPELVRLAGSMAHRLERVAEALDELATLATEPRAELLVAGRLSAGMLQRLERDTACRIRALVEERGLRTWSAGQRPPASALGALLEHAGVTEVGSLVAALADGAILDTRVLLAHRHGADEAAWPAPEDRYASDLLLADRVRDPWLRDLTLHAWSHDVPIALGAHSLVGPGLPLALRLPLPDPAEAAEAAAWS